MARIQLPQTKGTTNSTQEMQLFVNGKSNLDAPIILNRMAKADLTKTSLRQALASIFGITKFEAVIKPVVNAEGKTVQEFHFGDLSQDVVTRVDWNNNGLMHLPLWAFSPDGTDQFRIPFGTTLPEDRTVNLIDVGYRITRTPTDTYVNVLGRSVERWVTRRWDTDEYSKKQAAYKKHMFMQQMIKNVTNGKKHLLVTFYSHEAQLECERTIVAMLDKSLADVQAMAKDNNTQAAATSAGLAEVKAKDGDELIAAARAELEKARKAKKGHYLSAVKFNGKSVISRGQKVLMLTEAIKVDKLNEVVYEYKSL
jgi:hypothetical protein